MVAARDGHDFIPAALAAGASAYLTARAPVGATAVVVDDTSRALWALGAHARDRLGDRVVAITGSVGKTTVKDLVAGGLAGRFAHPRHPRVVTTTSSVSPSPSSVPRTGSRPSCSSWAPASRATSPRCVDLGRPAIGVITSIGTAHAEHLGGPGGVRPGEGIADRSPAGPTAMPS